MPKTLRRVGSVLLFSGLVLAGLGAAAATVTREVQELTGAAVRDPADENTHAVEVWTGDRTAAAELGAQAPGVYLLTLTGRFIGAPNVRYSLDVALTDGDQPRGNHTFWPSNLPADRRYHELTFPVILTRRSTLHAAFSLQDHAREQDAKAVKDAGLRQMEKPKAGQDEKEDTPELEGNPLPKGAASYLFSRVAFARQPAALVVTNVWPDKIHYYPEEKPTVAVTVTNLSEAAAKGTLLVEARWGLDQTRELLREEVSLAPGAELTKAPVLDKTDPYGYEIRATVTGATPEERHTASGYFSVSANVFEVSIQGWSRVGVLNDQESLRRLSTMPQAALDQLSADSARAARQGFFNHVECFSWAPDDFFNLSPTGDAWWSGTMTYIKVKRDIIAEIRALQKQGIKVLSYAQPYAIGIDTVRELRTNPEFFAYYGNGAPAVGYDYDLIKSRARLDMGLRPQEIGGGLNFYDLRTVDRGIDAVIASWKMFGWDGVRYDNRYYRANNPVTSTGQRAAPPDTNLDPVSARNVKRQKERFWKEIGPRWLISHNNGYNFHTADNKLGWEETVKDGLMCMDEETCGANEGSSNLNRWIDFMRCGLEARRFCTQLGGYYQLFPPGRGDTCAVDMLHYLVACAATGSHPLSCNLEGSAGGRYGRFLTRYAAMVFAKDIQPLEKPQERLAFPEAKEAELWWQPFANVRQPAPGRTWYLFPLVIPPLKERISADPGSGIPPPRTLKAVVPKAAFAAAPRAFLLTPEREEMAVPLTSTPIAAGYELQLPSLAHFGLLVLEEVAP